MLPFQLAARSVPPLQQPGALGSINVIPVHNHVGTEEPIADALGQHPEIVPVEPRERGERQGVAASQPLAGAGVSLAALFSAMEEDSR